MTPWHAVLLFCEAFCSVVRNRRRLARLELREALARAGQKAGVERSEADWHYLDRFTRALSRRFSPRSPCLVHALSLFELGPGRTHFVLFLRKENKNSLDGHAAVRVDSRFFSLAESRHCEEPFFELAKNGIGS